MTSSLRQLPKNWLPVQSTSPQCYPTCLTWKGDRFKSHLVSHKSQSVLVCTERDLKDLAMIVGSQMYCAVCPQVLCKTLQPKIPIDKVFAHLLHIIRRRQYFTGSVLDKLVHHIYEYLCNHISEVRSHCSTTDLSHQDLIWIKKQHRFASAQEIVLSERPSFPYSLAPFYDVISDSLNDYMKLFQELGVKNELSDKDIVSVLRKIKDNEGGRISDESAWKMVQHVLNWLTDSGECLASEKLDEDCNGALLIPIQSNSDRPVLVPVEEVVYTDLDFLKSFQSTEEETSFIHERVAHLARPLGVKPLSTHLNVSYDAFDDVGQHEPLVTRLKNILKDYKDGLTIVKELLQNADDAGATELTICYDARSHTVSEKSLLFQGMAKCHGPALLVHNNAAFTDEDFKNITKLAGGTKMNKPLKIGKFGVGFCSVYHITDVPSFISGKWLYIFDPTLSHLEKEIQDRSRPGKKLPFTEKIVRISKQLEPYKSLFGFDENREYDGTFFRFPFRTSGSEISTVIYDESHVQRLLHDLKLAGSKLLLFLSNLKRITFSRIDDDEGLSTLYSIEKESASATQAGLEYILPDYTELCEVHHYDDDNTYQHSKTELWLLASVVEDSDDYGKPATSTVACAIETNSLTATFTPQAINGEIFCYLPLSLQTGMPIHVSANFAVLNDRTGIHASDSDLSYEIEWNLELMKTVVPTAYYSLLLALKSLCENHKVSVSDYEFYSLWPLKEKLKSHNPWDSMVRHLYYKITKSELFYSHCTVKWLKLCDAHILAESVLTQMITEQHSPHQCVVNVFDELKYSLLRLPPSYQKHISQSELQPRMINEKRFTEIFFDEIGGISIETRNSVLFLILKVYAINSSNYLKDALVKNSCVPCSSDGTVLRMCHEVVDPKAEFSELYDDADEVFPTKSFYNDSLVRKALFDLNIIHDLLPWTNVLERANTIQLKHATNPLASLKRAMCILRCIKQHTETSGIDEIPFDLLETEFLPVMKRPQNYLAQLTWFGDGRSFSSSKYLVKGEHAAMIAGSQVCIVNESPPEGGGCGQISPLIASALQISTPSCESVIKHLMHIVNVYNGEKDRDSLKPRIEAACDKIYRHFELLLSEGKIFSSDLEDLRQSKCVWTGLTFISPQSVARLWQRNGPCLYSVPHLLVSKENLLGALGVNNEFTIDHYTAALEEIYSQRSILNDREISTISEIADKIANEIEDDDESTGIYYLPDKERVMRPTNDLAYNDAQWCAIDDDCHFIHHQISRPTALKLGVVAVRSKALQAYESSLQEWDGVPFGQHEELTQRIKNILDEYPLDITVLKELLQNADDAGASKLYVILDKRTHRHYRIPSSDWKDLQGPALLVWNDRGFSAKDLRGIQKLGLGSKRSNTEMIGQYGIGFNVVYHLTDCPSFFTNGDTLCVLDPHCSYIPGATSLKPGRMYDKVGDRFWKNWSDMKSCYLRDCDPNMKCPPELQEIEGTLFRLPLRHTSDLVKKSKLLDHESHSFNTPLGSWKMEEYLSEWAPRMKEALLFLKNVRELKFYVISDCPKPSFLITHHFKAHLEQDAAVKCGTFFKQVLQFTSNLQPFVTLYPLNLLEMEPRKSEEKWLIQQGVGDIQNDQQHWEYLTQMKPQHGIAASTSTEKVPPVNVHRVFCFLPLPLESRLPVHVNGKFVLDAARSGLWQSRDPTRPDDKQIWNKRLVEAAASSYVEFLVSCRERYISPEQYSSPEELKADITRYYNLFPRWDGKIKPEAEMNELSQSVYRGLLQRNPSVLAVIRRCTTQLKGSHNKKGNSFSVEWLPLKNDKDGSKQAYFLEDKEETKAIAGILKKIGIQLTVAPIYIQWHLSESVSDPSESKLPLATPESVFQYYCQYYMNIGNTFPCPVSDSVFGSVDRFITFVKYIVQEEHLENGTFSKFPKSPNDIPLLLTANSMLCMFSDSDKVISSKFANIFSSCGENFLHLEMFKLKLIPNYFLEPSESNWNFIRGILRRVLPTSLTVERVRHASDHIDVKDLLIPLWKCITTDKVFKVHIRDVLEEWALMLSKQNELFSLGSCDKVSPIVPPSKSTSTSDNSAELVMSKSDNQSDLTEKVFQIMEKCRVPILDASVVSVTVCKYYCPVMSEPEKVLQTLYYLHKNGELDLLLRDPKLDSKIETLFKYFSGIHFSHEQGKVSLARIKTLPLFKSIDNTYCSLPNESLIWPPCISSSGQDIWLKEISQTKVVFVKHDGLWNKLGSAAALGIKEISPLLLYVRFIFPHFHLLNEQVRLKHLQHIRDTTELFETAYYESEADFESEKKSESKLFLASLKQLPCLPKAGQLRPICDFYNPNIPILSMFLSDDCFPPTTMRDPNWLYFLNNIGLRVKATKEEFLTFCRHVSAADCDDVFKYSKALLEYLFAEVKWHAREHIEFLNDVSEIPFVCAEMLKPLAWIAPCADVENVVRHGKKTFKLTSLRNAASYDNRRLLWTTKPVIILPRLSYYSLQLSRKDWEEKQGLFYHHLQICVIPPCVEVVQNILNISKSRFSNFKLFDTYSKDCISQQKGKEELLCEVLVDCFTYLQRNGYSEFEMLALKEVPCIPVCSDGSTTNLSKPVLVKPLQAIIFNESEVEKFVPFLNPLPQRLYSAYHRMLEVIGVNSEVRYDNIRFALDVMRKHVKQPLDINTVEIVKMLIKKLYQCLQSVDSQGPFTTNDVLYLPNHDQQLVESTKLLFNDKDYRSHQFDLSQVSVSFLSLLVHKFEEIGVYRFTTKEFHSILPSPVRPLLLSTQTVERLSSSCAPDKNLTEFAEKIKLALAIPDFAKITKIMIGGHSEKQNDSCQRFSQGVSLLCESVEVLSVPNLTVDIFLKAHQSLTSIGTAKVDYLLETASNSISLYIDSGVHALTFNFFESLTSSIISFAAERSEVDVKCLDQPERAIGSLLKCPTSHQIKEMLHRLGINSANIELSGRINFDVTPKLGETIPEELHHRLHFDILNVFRPQEWVAYEDREDHYIFARIEYCINVTLHKHESDGELDNSEELSRFSIITSETDEIGIEVSVIDLRKILRMKEVVKDDGSTEVILYSSDSDSVHLWNAVKDDKLKSILREICQELRRIWNTGDKELWRKGKKAMYIKWHPDKNNTPFATKAFQFLRRQIERLEQGKPLEDPDDLDIDEVSPQQTETYPMWDDIVAREREYWEKERTRSAQQSSFDDNIQVNPDDNAAKAWFEQAKCDLIATQILLRETYHEERVCAHVCFLAHQVVEKALKAGMYKLFGLQSSTHNLRSYACAIEQQVPTSGGLQVLARQLEDHYIQARYPDAYYPPSAPSTHYKPDQATTAEHSAKTIVDIIQKIVYPGS